MDIIFKCIGEDGYAIMTMSIICIERRRRMVKIILIQQYQIVLIM